MIKVKICGITNLEDALMVVQEGADALGFIFSKKSPRYITAKTAKKIISRVGPFINTVGVFVNEDKDAVLDTVLNLKLDILQFHGSEPSSYCRFFSSKFKVVKVFFPQDRPFNKNIPRYKADAFLFDIRYEDKQKGFRVLSEDILEEVSLLIKEGQRVIVSGGLNVDNVDRAVKLSPYAVDAASGVEKFVGKKDKDLVRSFIRKVKVIEK